MQPPTSIPQTKLQIRAYDCKLTAQKVKRALLKLVESSPAFNESWINGEFDIGSRIGGLGQYGDIIIRHRTVLRGKHELTIEHRAGDELLAKEIEAAYGKDLTPKAPRMIKGKKRPHGMAYFFETIRGASLVKRGQRQVKSRGASGERRAQTWPSRWPCCERRAKATWMKR